MTDSPNPLRRTEHTLLSTDDAMVWSMEFCRIFNGKMIALDALNSDLHGPVDPGTMVGWFANAMATAVNIHTVRETHARGEKTEVEEFLDRWKEEHPGEEPLLEDDDDDFRDEMKEKFVEGFQEGRPAT